MSTIDMRDEFQALLARKQIVDDLCAKEWPTPIPELLAQECKRLEMEMARYSNVDWSLYDELLELVRKYYKRLLNLNIEGIAIRLDGNGLVTIVDGNRHQYVYYEIEISDKMLQYWRK